jgi:hypothetical protein
MGGCAMQFGQIIQLTVLATLVIIGIFLLISVKRINKR